MFFRNLTLFRFSPAVADDLQHLDDALDDHRLRPCGPLELFTRGFVPPVGRTDGWGNITLIENGCTLATLGCEDKLLPPAVVTAALQRKVQEISDKEGRTVGGRERKRIREDLLTELLPRALVRQSRVAAYVDLRDGWLVVDTGSRKAAELVLTHWREALGSFPAAPSAPKALRTPSFAELQTWALSNGLSGATDQQAMDAWRKAMPPVPTLEQFKRMGWGESEKNAADQAAAATGESHG